MEKKPYHPHHVYHPHPHVVNPTYPMDLTLGLDYDPTKINIDSHNQYTSSDSHDTTVEQFNFENIYPNAMAPYQAPVQAPVHAAAPAPAPVGCPGVVCPPNCLPEIYDPGKYDPAVQNLTNTYQNVVVPHIHPSHTTHNMHTHIVNQHYFPHTESCCFSASCEDVICGPLPPCPCPMPMPMPMHGHPGW